MRWNDRVKRTQGDFTISGGCGDIVDSLVNLDMTVANLCQARGLHLRCKFGLHKAHEVAKAGENLR